MGSVVVVLKPLCLLRVTSWSWSRVFVLETFFEVLSCLRRETLCLWSLFLVFAPRYGVGAAFWLWSHILFMIARCEAKLWYFTYILVVEDHCDLRVSLYSWIKFVFLDAHCHISSRNYFVVLDT